jgi:hypothetical protein
MRHQHIPDALPTCCPGSLWALLRLLLLNAVVTMMCVVAHCSRSVFWCVMRCCRCCGLLGAAAAGVVGLGGGTPLDLHGGFLAVKATYYHKPRRPTLTRSKVHDWLRFAAQSMLTLPDPVLLLLLL